MDPLLGRVTLGIYAALLAVGGVVGFAKAGSRPSLIAGLISALLAVGCLVAIGSDPKLGYWLGAGLAALLTGFFGPRFAASRKFMPAGLMVVISQVVLVVMLVGALGGGS